MVERISISPSEAAAVVAEHRTKSPGGSARGEMSVTVNQGIKGSVGHDGQVRMVGNRISSTPTETVLPDNLVQVGDMTVDRETAVARGWLKVDEDGTLRASDPDFKNALVEQQQNELVAHDAAETEAEQADNFNQAYDFLERELGHTKMAALANAVADGDEEALAAVPAPIFDGYMARGEEYAETLGIRDINSWAAALLTDEEQSELIKAVVSGREYEAKSLLERGKAAIEELSMDPDTHTELVSQGYSMEGTGLNAVVTFPNGGQLSLYDCFLQGHFTA